MVTNRIPHSERGGTRNGRRALVAPLATLALGGGLLVASQTAVPAVAPPGAPTAIAPDSVVPSRAGKAKQAIVKGRVAGAGGMRLIAVNAQGRAVVRVLSGSGAFSVPVARGTSLHLTTTDGEYYGPIILNGNGKTPGKGKKKGGKSKGKITGSLDYAFFNPGKKKSINMGVVILRGGWAAAKTPVPPALTDRTGAGSSIAQSGKPIGAGTDGRVSVSPGQLRNANNHPAIDLDRDGVIGAFDVDDNGNLVLDNVDNQTLRGSVRSREGTLDGQGFRMFSNYKATQPDFSDVINANVAVPTEDELNQSIRTKLGLAVQVIPGATLGCTGQVYCPGSPMPITAGASGDFQWMLSSTYPALTAADVNAGDTFVETAPDGTAYAGVLNFVFRTTPALKSFQVVNADGTAGGAVVDVDYGAVSPAGSANNPIQVTATQKVKLTFWRPQRRAFDGETGGVVGAVDIGKLNYMADAPNLGAGGCPATAGDGNGTTVPDGTWTNVQDNLGDAPTVADRTLAMVVDAGACAVAGGRTAGAPGQDNFDFDIQAKSLFGDNSAQKVYLKLMP